MKMDCKTCVHGDLNIDEGPCGHCEFSTNPDVSPTRWVNNGTYIPVVEAPFVPLVAAPSQFNSPDGPMEADPTGRDPHSPGAKLDSGKVRMSLVLGGFARALTAVAKVGTYGANKYTPNGWMQVPGGQERYADAQLRHFFKPYMGELQDKDTQYLHAAHEAWNSLAKLDLFLRDNPEYL